MEISSLPDKKFKVIDPKNVQRNWEKIGCIQLENIEVFNKEF